MEDDSSKNINEHLPAAVGKCWPLLAVVVIQFTSLDFSVLLSMLFPQVQGTMLIF
jgi:hypothetical protein